MFLVEFSIAPTGKGESVSAQVARAVDIVDKSGLDYRLNPMGTVIEGEWDEVFGTIRKCWEALSADCDRMQIVAKADWRRGASGRLESKLTAVQEKVGRKLKT